MCNMRRILINSRKALLITATLLPVGLPCRRGKWLTRTSLTVMRNLDAWAKISVLTIAPTDWIWILLKTRRLKALKAQSMSRILIPSTSRTRIFQPQANNSLCGGSCRRAR